MSRYVTNPFQPIQVYALIQSFIAQMETVLMFQKYAMEK